VERVIDAKAFSVNSANAKASIYFAGGGGAGLIARAGSATIGKHQKRSGTKRGNETMSVRRTRVLTLIAELTAEEIEIVEEWINQRAAADAETPQGRQFLHLTSVPPGEQSAPALA
jgi:hypothetical protein